MQTTFSLSDRKNTVLLQIIEERKRMDTDTPSPNLKATLWVKQYTILCLVQRCGCHYPISRLPITSTPAVTTPNFWERLWFMLQLDSLALD